MKPLTIRFDQLTASSSVEIYTLTVRDFSKLPKYKDRHGVDKIKLLREFRNLTGCGLKVAKDTMTALLNDGIVHVEAHFNYGDAMVVSSTMRDLGIRFVPLDGGEEDFQEDAKAKLIASIPTLPNRTDSAAEQLRDLRDVANKLGMKQAALALADLEKLVEAMKDCPAAIG